MKNIQEDTNKIKSTDNNFNLEEDKLNEWRDLYEDDDREELLRHEQNYISSYSR